MARPQMANMQQNGRSIVDTSADFAVEEDLHGNLMMRRDGPAKDFARGNSPDLPKWHKQPKSNASLSSGSNARTSKGPVLDLDPHRLGQRQKQVDYGKNTLGYQRYLKQVPKGQRQRRNGELGDPETPDINQNISKRCFDGQIKVWRRQLHKYDMEAEDEARTATVVPQSYAERTRQQGGSAVEAAVSAVASSPTNSSRSRGSLDGYMAPAHVDTSGRKRGFQRAFDHLASDNPHPSKLLTSPAGPKPAAPQSAPPATASNATAATSTAGRCVDPPSPSKRPATMGPRAASCLGMASTGMPKAPQTAPPGATRASGSSAVAASTTTAEPAVAAASGATRGSAAAVVAELGKAAAAGGGEDLFTEWVDEDYAGLEQWEEEELDVQL